MSFGRRVNANDAPIEPRSERIGHHRTRQVPRVNDILGERSR